jgi:hypothetical protein
VLAHSFIWVKDRQRLALTRDRHLLSVARVFAPNSLCLYHPDDEAIKSLTAVPQAKLAIFDQRFLSGISLTLVLMATPIIFLASFISAAEIMAVLLRIQLPPPSSVLEYIQRGVQVANYIGGRFTDPILFRMFGTTWGYNLQFLLLVTAFVAVCFGVFVTVGWVSKVLSKMLAKHLNSLATFHVAQAVYGGDEVGTVAQASSSRAFDGAGLSYKLPERIEKSIREAADRAAAESIFRLRQRLSLIISSIGREEVAHDHFLTWDELIHTTYFRVAEMRMLLCCAIARSGGFVGSEQLVQSDAAEWLSEWLASLNSPSCAQTG